MSSLCKRAVCLSQKKVGEKNCFFKILWHLIFSCLYLNTINKLIFYFVVCNLVISFRSLFRITCHSFLGSDLLLGFSCFFFYELLYHSTSLFLFCRATIVLFGQCPFYILDENGKLHFLCSECYSFNYHFQIWLLYLYLKILR